MGDAKAMKLAPLEGPDLEPFHRIGTEVTVLYPPAEPGAARIQSFQTLWLLPTFISGFGLVMAGVSAGAFVASRKA